MQHIPTNAVEAHMTIVIVHWHLKLILDHYFTTSAGCFNQSVRFYYRVKYRMKEGLCSVGIYQSLIHTSYYSIAGDIDP